MGRWRWDEGLDVFLALAAAWGNVLDGLAQGAQSTAARVRIGGRQKTLDACVAKQSELSRLQVGLHAQEDRPARQKGEALIRHQALNGQSGLPVEDVANHHGVHGQLLE